MVIDEIIAFSVFHIVKLKGAMVMLGCHTAPLVLSFVEIIFKVITS
jgi:hypothetical protein